MTVAKVGIPALRTGQKPLDDFGANVKEWIERCSGARGPADDILVTFGDLKTISQRTATGAKRQVVPGDIVVDVGSGLTGSISIDSLAASLLGNQQFKTALAATAPTPTKTTISEEPARVEQELRRMINDMDGRLSAAERSAASAAEAARNALSQVGSASEQVVFKVGANGTMAGTGSTSTGSGAGAGTHRILIEAAKFAMVTSSDVLGTGPGEIDPLAPSFTRVPFGIDGDGVAVVCNIKTGGKALFEGVASLGLGTFAVVANSAGAAQHGMYGLGTSGSGFYGETTNGTGVTGHAYGTGTGVHAISVSGVALKVAGTMTMTSTTLVSNLNADMVDGLHAGNSSGQVPVSNGTVSSNLNADMVDGLHAASFSLTSHNHTGVYSPVGHDHSGVYSPVGHDHSGTYAALSHGHGLGDISAGSRSGNIFIYGVWEPCVFEFT